MLFKFIHAADIHLDSPLKGLEQYEGAPADEIRNAARRALENLVELAIEESVAFVLVAGDFYDGDWRDYNTGLFFIRQMSRLKEANIPVFLIAGNHDAANRMTRNLRLPDQVHLFSARAPEWRTLPDLDVQIHGQSFATAAIFDNLSEAYPTADNGLFHIGLLHTCASSQEHERYAPCSLDDLRHKGYQYWALGHVHQRQTLLETPWAGFPGNIQGRHIRETGPKGCLLVTVEEDQQLRTEFVPLDVMRWERAVIPVDQVRSPDEVLDLVESKLNALHAAAEGRLLAVRVELQGSTPAHRVLQAKRHHWTNEIRSLALEAGQGEIWVEKIRLETSLPASQRETEGVSRSALNEIKALFAEASSDLSVLENWNFDGEDLVKKLPTELRALIPLDDHDWLRSRLTEAEAYLFNELLSTEESA